MDLKPHSKIWFSVNPPVEGSLNSMEEMTELLAQSPPKGTLVGKGGCSKTQTMQQLLSRVTFNIKNFFPLSSISYTVCSCTVIIGKQLVKETLQSGRDGF